MRLTSSEAQLSALDSSDRVFVNKLARARGHFTLTDYAKYRQTSRQAVYGRLQRKVGVLFKRLRPSAANSFPEIYFLARRFAYTMNPDYQEPRTIHTLLDGLLRSRLIGKDDGQWSHHTRQPAVFVSKNEIDVIDCLDRTVFSVLQFAKDLKPEGKALRIHCGLSQRVAAMEFLQKRRVGIPNDGVPKKEEALTWDSLFGERERKLSAPETKILNPIEVVYHDIPAFHFIEVC